MSAEFPVKGFPSDSEVINSYLKCRVMALDGLIAMREREKTKETTEMTEKQAKEFAVAWYRMIDDHTPVLNLIQRASEDLIVDFPGNSLSLEAYVEWYTQDIRSNFNGKHEIHTIRTEVGPDQATVFMEITWTAETWTPPAAHSQHVCLKPNVTLTLVPDGQGGLLLKRYAVVDRED